MAFKSIPHVLKVFLFVLNDFSSVASNKVRNNGKWNLHFKNVRVKSQSFKNDGKNAIRVASRGINTNLP